MCCTAHTTRRENFPAGNTHNSRGASEHVVKPPCQFPPEVGNTNFPPISIGRTCGVGCGARYTPRHTLTPANTSRGGRAGGRAGIRGKTTTGGSELAILYAQSRSFHRSGIGKTSKGSFITTRGCNTRKASAATKGRATVKVCNAKLMVATTGTLRKSLQAKASVQLSTAAHTVATIRLAWWVQVRKQLHFPS